MKTKFLKVKSTKVTIDKKRLMADFIRTAAPSITVLATNEVMPAIEQAQREMIEEFVQHPVTQEINAGPKASNISGTLGGVGNLFSFLGFYQSENPTLNILEILRRAPYVSKVSSSPNGKINVYIKGLPTTQEIFQNTPLSWADGKSWAEGIEKGVAGFGRFLYSDSGLNSSRSGSALQIKNLLRGGKMRNTKYISAIINNFINKI